MPNSITVGQAGPTYVWEYTRKWVPWVPPFKILKVIESEAD